MHVDEIKLKPGSPLCEVVIGPTRRVYISSRHAVGLALLQDAADQAEGSLQGLQWVDMLISHGVAVGTRGPERFTLAVIPAQTRTVHWSGPVYANTSDPTSVYTSGVSLKVGFPPLLVMLRVKEGRYVRAFMFCVNPTALKTLSVTGTAPVLSSFPYGNVYADGGRICWGTVEHSTLVTIDDVLHTFFESRFNTDLFHSATCGVRLRNLHEMVQQHPKALPIPQGFPISIPAQLQLLLGDQRE